MICGGGCQLRASFCRVWTVVCSRASWVPRSKYSDRVPLLRGCALLKPEQVYLKVEDVVLLGNGTVSEGNRFPTKTSGSSIETSDITQHHITEERNPQIHPAS